MLQTSLRASQPGCAWKKTIISHKRSFLSESKQRGHLFSFTGAAQAVPFEVGRGPINRCAPVVMGYCKFTPAFHFEKASLSTCPHDVPIIIRPSLPAVTGQGLAPGGALLKSPTFLS